MGELNDLVDHYEAGEIIVDWLAKYLYENFETDPYPSSNPNAVIGDIEPWESAGKRVRERWQLKATEMIMDFSKIFISVTG